MFLENDPLWFQTNARHSGQPPPARNLPVADQLPVTAAAHRALEQERDKFRDEKLRQFPERLRLVREFGDTANNDEHLAIREEEMVVDARLERLEDILSRARVVDPAASGGTIAIGSIVTVLDLGAGKPFDYLIDSALAPLAPNAVSAVSPVGRALLGRSPGEIVTVALPKKGRTRKLEILAITPLSPR